MAKKDRMSHLVNKEDPLLNLSGERIQCRVHKLNWKDAKVSSNWLQMIKTLHSSAATENTTSDYNKDIMEVLMTSQRRKEGHSIIDELGIQYQDDMTSSETMNMDPDHERSAAIETLPQFLIESLVCSSRKPNPAYISLVSQIHVPECFSKPETAKNASKDANFSAPTLTQTIECDEDEEKCQPPLLFPSQKQLEAKRKLSFEYIQEVSKLESVFCQ